MRALGRGKGTGSCLIQETPKIFGDPCGHDRLTGPAVGVVDGTEVWHAVPNGRPPRNGPSTARAFVVAGCWLGVLLLLVAGGRCPLGRRRGSPRPCTDRHRSDQRRPVDRPGGIGSVADPGAPDGPNPFGGEDLRPG